MPKKIAKIKQGARKSGTDASVSGKKKVTKGSIASKQQGPRKGR